VRTEEGWWRRKCPRMGRWNTSGG